MINIVNELDKSYGLYELFKKGIIPWTVLRDRDIFLQYDIYIRMGKPAMDAIQQTADDFNVNWRTVYRAISKMKDEKDSNTSK